MNRWIAFFIHNNTLVNILTVFVFASGIYALLNIKRESFPNVDFDAIQVLVSFPGASPETVEKLVTNPLEQALGNVEGVSKLSSVSTEGVSVIGLELDPDVTTSREAQSDVQDVVDSWNDSPEDMQTPRVTALKTKDFPVIKVSLTGEGISEERFKMTAQLLERSIEALPDVARVNLQGIRDYEIQVAAKSEELRRWDVSLSEIITALQRNNVNIPGGVIWPEVSSDSSVPLVVRTVADLETLEDIENTVIRANALGTPVYVKNVATVTRGFTEQKTLHRTNGLDSYNLVVIKKERGDIIRLVSELRELMSSDKVFLPTGMSYTFTDDASYFVSRRLNVLKNNLMVGLALVVLILSIALPFRMALISAFGIPFAFLAAITLMYLIGVSINIISMLGLILVLGMLVDDAIVVTENAQRNIELGLKPVDAALKSAAQIWPPLLTSVSTTMMAFLPLMFLSGTLGKFISFIPYGVLLGLLASLAECFFILPNHIAHWSRPTGLGGKSQVDKNKKNDRWWQRRVLPFYHSALKILIKLRYGVLVFVALLFIGTMAFFKKNMRFSMFPAGTIASFSFIVEGDITAQLGDTSDVLALIEKQVRGLPPEEIKDFTSVSGQNTMGRRRSVTGYQYGQVQVNLTESNIRERTANEIIEDLKSKIGSLPEGFRYRVSKARAGPPQGKPVEVGIRGEHYRDIRAAAAEVKKALSDIPGVTDIADTYRPGKTEVHVQVDPYQASAASLSLGQIGQTVRASYAGIVATTVRTVSEEVDIRVFLREDERKSLQALKELKIPNSRGQRIPLSKIASFVEKESTAAYEHEANQRQLVVEGEIDLATTSSLKVNEALKEKLGDFAERVPEVTLVFAGEQQETRRDLAELVKIVLIALSGIILIIILLFKNIIQPLAVALTIPMGVIPVIWTFFLHGLSLSFLALVGMVALAGVIVNNAIVLTDFANKRLEEYGDFIQSLLAAAQIRLRPILLTTVTTVCGILPTAYGIGGLDPFVKPLALSLGWGLAVGSLMVCLFFPPILAIAHDIRRLTWWVTGLPGRLIGDDHAEKMSATSVDGPA